MFYCSPCPEPRVPGYYLAKIYHNGHADMYYWDSNIRTVILHRSNDTWYVMPDYDIRASLDRIYGNSNADVVVSGVRIFEHGVDSTQPNDDARFLECMWSDYGMDGLSVRATVEVVARVGRRASISIP